MGCCSDPIRHHSITDTINQNYGPFLYRDWSGWRTFQNRVVRRVCARA